MTKTGSNALYRYIQRWEADEILEVLNFRSFDKESIQLRPIRNGIKHYLEKKLLENYKRISLTGYQSKTIHMLCNAAYSDAQSTNAPETTIKKFQDIKTRYYYNEVYINKGRPQ